jgi:anoctamin-10/anoctamin-7
VTPLNAYDFIYGAYHDKYKSMFIQHPANDKTCGLTSVLKDTDRIRLLLSIIGAPKASGGCGVSLDRLVRKGTIIGYSPAHSYAKLEALTKRWLVFCQSPWNKDVVDGVRDYFGEKIALYVLWLQHSLQWLCVGAAVGALAWINVCGAPYPALCCTTLDDLSLTDWCVRWRLKTMTPMHLISPSTQPS